MIKEAYVSFEIAKLLKEKGFDEDIHTWYKFEDGESEFIEGYIKISNVDFVANDEDSYSAPTHQMACAWLREKHLIHVYAEHRAFFQEKKPKKLYYHWMPFVKTLPHCQINKIGFPKDTISLDVYCNTYEEAVGAALKYALENLI